MSTKVLVGFMDASARSHIWQLLKLCFLKACQSYADAMERHGDRLGNSVAHLP